MWHFLLTPYTLYKLANLAKDKLWFWISLRNQSQLNSLIFLQSITHEIGDTKSFLFIYFLCIFCSHIQTQTVNKYEQIIILWKQCNNLISENHNKARRISRQEIYISSQYIFTQVKLIKKTIFFNSPIGERYNNMNINHINLKLRYL